MGELRERHQVVMFELVNVGRNMGTPITKHPNEWLKKARQGVESPRTPGLPMSRQELAEAVAAQIHRASRGRETIALAANQVGKWERLLMPS